MAKHDHSTAQTTSNLPAATRRRAIGLAAGAAALAVTGAQAADGTTDPLEDLWGQYQQVVQRFKAACAAELDADETARTACPPWPSVLFGRDCTTNAIVKLTRDDIVRWRDQAIALGLPGVEVHQQQLAAWDTWRSACDEVDAAHGLPELERRSAALLDELKIIEDAIIATPAASLRGALVKLRLLGALEEYAEDEDEQDAAARLVVGLISDLEAATVPPAPQPMPLFPGRE